MILSKFDSSEDGAVSYLFFHYYSAVWKGFLGHDVTKCIVRTLQIKRWIIERVAVHCWGITHLRQVSDAAYY